MPNESISHCSMVVSACLRIIKKKKKKPWFGIHLIQHRLALKRHFHSLVFAFKTSASTLSSAATTSRVKLVQWSLLGVHGGNTKMERLLLPEVMCDKKQKPSRWLSQSHPLSWNVKHTCRHRNMCSHIFFFLHLFFSVFLLSRSAPRRIHKFKHTLVRCRADERKLMLDQCLVQEADLAV